MIVSSEAIETFEGRPLSYGPICCHFSADIKKFQILLLRVPHKKGSLLGFEKPLLWLHFNFFNLGNFLAFIDQWWRMDVLLVFAANTSNGRFWSTKSLISKTVLTRAYPWGGVFAVDLFDDFGQVCRTGLTETPCGRLGRNRQNIFKIKPVGVCFSLRVRGQHTKTTGRRGRTVGVSKKK